MQNPDCCGIAISPATRGAIGTTRVVGLTEIGLVRKVRAIEMDRQIDQRMLTHTPDKIIKTLEIDIFMGAGKPDTEPGRGNS